MPPEAKCVAHRVIVTGNVEKSFAMKDLYKFGVFLHNNKFWFVNQRVFTQFPFQ